VTDIDQDLFDMFKRQYDKQLLTIQDSIDDLKSIETYETSVNSLFRVFHNYKSSTSYMELETIKELVVAVENTLESIRRDKGPAQSDIIEWLYKVNDQLIIWQEEMQENKQTFSKVAEGILHKVTLTQPCTKLKDKLKTLNLLYIDKDTQRASKVVHALEKLSIDVEYRIALPKEKNLLKIDICILNSSINTFATVQDIKKEIPKAGVIVIVDKMTESLKAKLMFMGVNNFLINPLRGSDLRRELHNITLSHFSNRRILITNTKIHSFIQTLKPLPSSIFEIQDICNDEERSIKELIAVVKKDPIITANILDASKSPIYGLKNITTIDQAVSIFGKRTVNAIVISDLSKNIPSLDLEAYSINEETFSRVATLRLSLMIKWYSKVSISLLSTLSLSAILGNLGQLLLASEIKKSDKQEEFKQLALNDGFQIAEEKLFHTNTTSITHDILKYYKLSFEITDSIRYSDKPADAPLEIHQLAIANHIVFNTVLLNGSINKEISKEILQLMEEEKLDTEPLIKAIQYISQL